MKTHILLHNINCLYILSIHVNTILNGYFIMKVYDIPRVENERLFASKISITIFFISNTRIFIFTVSQASHAHNPGGY